MTETCLVVAVIGTDRYPCLSHEGRLPAHHFAAHWPPCEAPWCKLPPGHRELHDIPAGQAQIIAPVTEASGDPALGHLIDAANRHVCYPEDGNA